MNDDAKLCAARLRKNEKRWVLRETHAMPDSIWHGEWCGHLIELDPNSSTNWRRTKLCHEVEALLKAEREPCSATERDDTVSGPGDKQP